MSLCQREYVDFTVVGFPTNLTWELQARAKPNCVLVGEATYQAIRDKFAFQEQEPVEVKGHSQTAPVYQLVEPDDQ